jgi:c-di-GMP-binding flagellar brake protein YcgR
MTSSNKKDPVAGERRRHNRLSADVAAALTIGLVAEDGSVYAPVPIDISTGGVCLRWPSEDPMVLDVGQRVELRIQPSTTETPVVVQAVVRWTGADDDGSVRYGLEFDDLYKIFEDVIPALWQVCHALHGPR